MEARFGNVHHVYMATTKTGPGHFLRAWRTHLGLSLEAVAERIEVLSAERAVESDARPMTMTHASLSRIERGLVPYNQNLLEILAEIYKTDPASLIIRDPSAPEGIWSIWDQLSSPQRTQMVEIAKTLKRTGTGG